MFGDNSVDSTENQPGLPFPNITGESERTSFCFLETSVWSLQMVGCTRVCPSPAGEVKEDELATGQERKTQVSSFLENGLPVKTMGPQS